MPITGQKAAELARKHNLRLADAKALMDLADDDTHAEQLATDFADDADYDAIADEVFRGRGGK